MNTTRILASLSLAYAAALLVSCSSVEEGVIVRKSRKIRRIEPYAAPTQSYWVEVEGHKEGDGMVTKRIPLFDSEWAALKKGDRISLRDYNPFRLTKARAARIAGMDAPPPSGRKPSIHADSRATASKKRQARTAANPPSSRPKPEASASPTPGKKTARNLADEETRYRQIEAKAMDDPTVRRLKEKIHTAKSDAEQAQASQEYHRARFSKMRQLDPSLAPLIDGTEASFVTSGSGSAVATPSPAASPHASPSPAASPR